MREKLIEMIHNASFTCPDGITNCHDCEYCEEDAFGNPCNERKLLADYFIANDVVPVVRCKDCKWYDNREGVQWCRLNSKFYKGCFDWHSFPEDGFCSYGERRADG